MSSSIVFSFLELIPYLLSLDGANFVLSERFNQDNVGIFWGKQRGRCGRGYIPTVSQFLYNVQSIHTGLGAQCLLGPHQRENYLLKMISMS